MSTEALGLTASAALGVVLLISGLAKLGDLPGTREAAADFGLGAAGARVVAPVLVAAELAGALGLAWPATRRVAAVGVVLLLAALTAAVVVALRAGRRPTCHCFGRIGSAELSGRTVARNIALLVLATTATFTAPTRGWGELGGGGVAGSLVLGALLGGVIIAVEAVSGRAALARRERADEAAFDRTERDSTPVADFTLPRLTGEPARLSELLALGRPALLVALSAGCGPCARLRPEVGRWVAAFGTQLTVVVLATGDLGQNLRSYQDAPGLVVLHDESQAVSQQLGLSSTPAAVLVGVDGLRYGGVASGEALVRRLLVRALTGAEMSPAEEDTALWEDDGVPADQLDLDSAVAPRPSVEAHPLAEGALLLETRTGATVQVDRLGSVVWSVLDGSPLREIAADIADVFAAPLDVVAGDLLGVVRELGEAGLLAGVVPTGARRVVEASN